MVEKYPFNHKEARNIINDGYNDNLRVVDNEGNVYDYVSKIQKKLRGDDYFYAKRADEKDFKYIFFTIDGKSIQSELNLTLFIEKNTDFGKFDILIGGENDDTVYLKLKAINEYLVVSMVDRFQPFVRGIVYSDWFGEEGFREANYEQKDRIYQKLYEINVGYDIVKHTTFPLVKELKKEYWYKYYNNLFQVKEDYVHDLREVSDIPYIYNISLDSNSVYKNSVMGLPKNVCISDVSIDDIERAYSIISRDKKDHKTYDVEVLKCRISNTQDVDDIKYLLQLQELYKEDIVVSDRTTQGEYDIFPDIFYCVYVNVDLHYKLKESDETYERIYENWMDDRYDGCDEMPGLKDRVFKFKTIIVC